MKTAQYKKHPAGVSKSVYIEERKGKKEKYLYSAIYYASIVSKRSDMDHTVLPAN